MSHLMESCEALRVAAESQQKAAESQKKACDSVSQHLRGELSQCKIKDKGSSAQDHSQCSGSMGQHSSAVAMLLFVSLSFILS
ncbi:hypothetical protein Z043_101744 [Scleropages formosus]|nr:hypothetical protein Z043_101744 [Scleropages formosus]